MQLRRARTELVHPRRNRASVLLHVGDATAGAVRAEVLHGAPGPSGRRRRGQGAIVLLRRRRRGLLLLEGEGRALEGCGRGIGRAGGVGRDGIHRRGVVGASGRHGRAGMAMASEVRFLKRVREGATSRELGSRMQIADRKGAGVSMVRCLSEVLLNQLNKDKARLVRKCNAPAIISTRQPVLQPVFRGLRHVCPANSGDAHMALEAETR